MGGGETSTEVLCQMCDEKGHSGASCPWIYTKCSIPKCNGLILLMTSKMENSCGRKYLKCQHESCEGWQWLEDALAKYKSTHDENMNASSSNASSTSNGCFHCGENDHWVRLCPWKDTKCPNGCQGTRKLWTSRKERSYGQIFLKCLECEHFEWVADAKEKVKENRSVNVRVQVEVSLDDLCKSLKSKFNV